jgi:hypothetical protein
LNPATLTNTFKKHFRQLPQSFLPDLKSDIVFGAKVSAIKQHKKKGVFVTISCSGIECPKRSSGTASRTLWQLFKRGLGANFVFMYHLKIYDPFST